MKRALLILGILVVFVVVGLGIFLATFDADRYRPVVVKQLASALGRPVRLERLSLGWRGGLALQLNGLAVFRDPASPEPIAQAERVSATLQLLPLFQRQLELSTLDIANGRLRLCDFSGPNQPCLRGTLNGSFQGAAQGLAWPEASRSLSGQGRLMLTEARIEHLNILREVFQRLSLLPGLLEALQARLPPSYQARLDARDTILHPVDAQVTAADGALTFAELHVETDDLVLKGAGRVGLDGTLTAQASVWIDPELSTAIIRSVNELQSLADARGRLELPVVVQGTLPRVAVLPDLGQIGSRLVVHKAQELIGGLLQRALEQEQDAPPSSGP